ncbi:MAG TPA: hypothetical protein VM619_04385 [Luteimonas sp.]|nr:hypothetical protein [Luteimonas sp.]
MPAPALAPFVPWLATAGFGWLYYRRIRRQFGRQPYRPTRTGVRIALLSLVGCGLLVLGFVEHRLAPAIGTGAIAGAALGWLALRHTRIAVVDGVREYTPNPWIGGAISLLLVARLAWRWHAGAFAAGAQQAGSQASPLTMGILATLVAYYLVTGIGLVQRMRALPAQSRDGGGDAGTPPA